MGLMDFVVEALGELPRDARLLAAVSGGADSTAMLAACAAVRGRSFCEGDSLSVVHVDHGLRPQEECDGDAEAVRSLCRRLGVECTVAMVGRGKIEAWARDEGSGIEAAARHFRHEALRREAERMHADFILVAHTQDDALETALMRFLRGAGPRGLALMPRFAPVAYPQSGFSTGDSSQEDRGKTCLDYAGTNPRSSSKPAETKDHLNGAGSSLSETGTSPYIFRPLRDVTRTEVLIFLAEQGLSYRTDSTNADVRYLRNRVRWCLVPVLDENFPEWRKGLLETAETQGLVADFIESELKKRVRIHNGGSKSTEESGVVIENLEELPEILREEALFAAIDRVKEDERTVRRQVVRDFARDSQMKATDVGDGIRLGRGSLPVRVARDEAFYEKGFSLLIKEAGEYSINGLLIQVANVDGSLAVHIKGKHNG
jgi:tRNA(Ile)-lysidine synthase